jgi:hypothetical protein
MGGEAEWDRFASGRPASRRFPQANGAGHRDEGWQVRADAGWGMAAIGEGESTLLSLVDAKGDPAGITGLAYRDATGNLIRIGRAK